MHADESRASKVTQRNSILLLIHITLHVSKIMKFQ